MKRLDETRLERRRKHCASASQPRLRQVTHDACELMLCGRGGEEQEERKQGGVVSEDWLVGR